MTTDPKRAFMQTLLFFMVALIGLIVIDQATAWDLAMKIIWPVAWSVAGLIFALYQLHRRHNPPKEENAAPIRSSNTENKKSSAFNILLGYIIWLVMVAVIIGGLSWIARLFQANVDREIAKLGPLPILRQCGEQSDTTVHQCFERHKIYDIFPIDADQCWRTFAKDAFEYRVRITGDEKFHLASPYYELIGHPGTTGLLQMKTRAKDLCLDVSRVPMVKR